MDLQGLHGLQPSMFVSRAPVVWCGSDYTAESMGRTESESTRLIPPALCKCHPPAIALQMLSRLDEGIDAAPRRLSFRPYQWEKERMLLLLAVGECHWYWELSSGACERLILLLLLLLRSHLSSKWWQTEVQLSLHWVVVASPRRPSRHRLISLLISPLSEQDSIQITFICKANKSQPTLSQGTLHIKVATFTNYRETQQLPQRENTPS